MSLLVTSSSTTPKSARGIAFTCEAKIAVRPSRSSATQAHAARRGWFGRYVRFGNGCTSPNRRLMSSQPANLERHPSCDREATMDKRTLYRQPTVLPLRVWQAAPSLSEVRPGHSSIELLASLLLERTSGRKHLVQLVDDAIPRRDIDSYYLRIINPDAGAVVGIDMHPLPSPRRCPEVVAVHCGFTH